MSLRIRHSNLQDGVTLLALSALLVTFAHRQARSKPTSLPALATLPRTHSPQPSYMCKNTSYQPPQATAQVIRQSSVGIEHRTAAKENAVRGGETPSQHLAVESSASLLLTDCQDGPRHIVLMPPLLLSTWCSQSELSLDASLISRWRHKLRTTFEPPNRISSPACTEVLVFLTYINLVGLVTDTEVDVGIEAGTHAPISHHRSELLQ
ncbi:hypothetical protein P153DRAFT_391282 [Dothidotthia symphoricarpi CBS 119687]|uniref:Uncharacterized protein n=1 Tax=Dothidotthia symphoricarpi CBS 119687 TaxID=1392245 RepID=A0A6A5ZXQ0_9PLEO|nr:uncharacterized protein P153DRAFT_391282 [Dothidotthia symphoricarpi CBS 119687]KAF2123684.1 hypothetical protein P153DRAFT_391282 [Dothidotthia symphoricarpi CBS 119687]